MIGFTKTLAAINLLGAVVSISLFVATFFAQGFIVKTARSHALDSTRTKLEPVVRFLENPKLAVALSSKLETRLEEELAEYRRDPDAWLLRVADGTKDRAKTKLDFTEVRNPLARKALDSIERKVSGAREHFSKSYANLIRDVRIFCGTNAVAFLVAAWLLWVARTRTMRHWLGAWSVVLMACTMAGSWIYVNQNWWRTVFFNEYYGWSYLAINLGAAVYLFLRMSPTLWATRPESD
ncbi:MAG: hypothetical protein EOP85_12675 [Verrucomicrobiaceae bacterium]|nr:MAG: hypothetical protein EOP85_12675 [Verrucomicrobiaceae bacterium]